MLKIQNETFSSIFLKSIKMAESLPKEYSWTTHGHGHQHGDWLGGGERAGWGGGREKEKTSRDNRNSIKNKN